MSARTIGFFTLAILSVVVIVVVGVRQAFYNPEPEITPQGLVQPATVNAATPEVATSHVLIPALSLDVPIEARGLTTGDRMAAPAYFSDVGWYKYGPAPGDNGLAILYGHRDNGFGLDGAFRHLSDIKVGDTVQVVNKEGVVTNFKVDHIEEYPYKEVPAFRAGGDPGVALISCVGKWVKDPTIGWTYTKRIVVYASKA